MASAAVPLALVPAPLRAQETGQASTADAPAASPDPAGPEFSFDLLTDRMRDAARQPPAEPRRIEGALTRLDYDDYQRIRYNRERERWNEDPTVLFRLNAFHPGWLFNEPVQVHEVVDGRETAMRFSVEDFEYYDVKTPIPADFALPGVAGFRLMTPINRADKFDELVAFLGASYFRALGRDTVYGLSARGLAVNTGHSDGEEFPRFSEFWIERPAPGSQTVIFYAALTSASVTGAFRFTITPGTTTSMEVTARLFARSDIAQLGIAPLTSMFLFGGADSGEFDDFRPAVHDSEALVLNTRGGDTFFRALNNPPRLAMSFLSAENPASFGLVQRTRDFDEYLDAQAHYERRPTLMVEPIGDWGKGSVRLLEIPSDLEGNDNIVAFWTPDAPMTAGSELEMSYRLHWGLNPQGAESSHLAHVLRTRAGKGGVSGVEGKSDRRKFVIDFHGGLLAELPDDAEVTPQVSILRGEVAETVLSRIPGTQVWRLVIEARTDSTKVAELKATLTGFGRTLTETWLYQWVKS